MTTVERVQALLAASGFQQAYELARQAPPGVGDDAPLVQRMTSLAALAAARAGAWQIACETLEPLVGGSLRDVSLAAEVSSLQGRLLKDRLEDETDPTEQALLAGQASGCYEEAYAACGNPYPLINAASMRMLAHDREASVRMAKQALKLLASPEQRDHWSWATAAEAHLLCGEVAQARVAYSQARASAGKRFGDVAAIPRQLHLLERGLPDARSLLDDVAGPQVVVYTGHMIDEPGRSSPRLPPSLEAALRREVENVLAEVRPDIAYGQAACGSDLLFCEELLERGAELHLVLPYAEIDYGRNSVATAGPGWVHRFEAVKRRATSLTFATEGPHLGDDVLYDFASELIQGLALLRAQSLRVRPLMLSVLDEAQPGGPGGARDTHRLWGRRGLASRRIDLAALRAMGTPARPCVPAEEEVAATRDGLTPRRRIRCLLFADVKGFSQLQEPHYPRFFQDFLGCVPQVLQQRGLEALQVSSSGDGLYVVFADPNAAADFGWHLSARVGSLDWPALGLPADTHLRTALHAGPVFEGIDPVSGLKSYYGSHVTRAARVEPAVLPGQVGVTEPFAALLSARSDPSYTCEFVGNTVLAKSYGRIPLYRLRKRHGA